MNQFETVTHDVDLCVVGGGLAGLCAAVAAARHGARVALMQERPMLGGNASSEIRMWVCGAHGKNNRETGLLEEIMMDNNYRNPDRNYSIWDGILYEKAVSEKNITLLLNCTCSDCTMDGNSIVQVKGWQMTTQQFHVIRAKYFADCSGDSVLAPLTGAKWRMGREMRAEFEEDIEPEHADKRTMGMSCMIQAREETQSSTFTAPEWSRKITAADLAHRMPNMSNIGENFWYLELGGTRDSIRDTESLRHELLALAYGVWDFIKNDPEQKEKNKYWRLDWMGILPGKRESRRYEGDYILTQNDVRAEGRFEDVVAYGGWTMDDHNPAGFNTPEPPNTFHPAPSPFGIPYRCLYSRNIDNLFFAGRNISVTHAAMSATRVMATCAMLGQAVGTAAAIAARDGLSPRQVNESSIGELRQTLMDDDCYLPFARRAIPQLTREAKLECEAADPEALRNGLDRPIGACDNGCMVEKGHAITYAFDSLAYISSVRVVFDSDLNRENTPGSADARVRNMIANRPLSFRETGVPYTMVKSFSIEVQDESGCWDTVFQTSNNYHRLVTVPVARRASTIRLTPLDTWGARLCHVFSFDVSGK